MYSIGVVGNGFVGSSLAAGFSLHAEVKIYDVDARKATHTFTEVANSDYIFVAVPTPMKEVTGGGIDLTIMNKVIQDLANANEREDNVIIIKSTVIPGTIQKYIDKHLNLNIIHSPEFLTERVARLDFINSARIVLGGEKKDTEKAKKLFRVRFPHTKIIQTNAVTAEFIKYMANSFFAVKVSFMNELKQAAEKLNVDWDGAMDGFTSDGRVGNSHLDVPGHDGKRGFGGKCFPKDINAFIHLFEKIEIKPTVMKAAWEKNLEVRSVYDWKDIKGAVTDKGENDG
tara:strand:+ start:3708 stop:4562 length:855 start_codon:yes stop_codon:yes gene_type:complete